ncbi:hypothetical protein [Streptococcus suis]|uniref:hypothetical protein n=1 Tax=Streptococcus suis TaxID=1307 RepID=UPI0004046DE7|nr:hypothetical protein [Streptococcus suis]
MIKDIKSISLFKQNLSLDSVPETSEEGKVSLTVGLGIETLDYNESTQTYRALTRFHILFEDSKQELFSVMHMVSFTTEYYEELEEMVEDKNFNFAVFEIIEPYIRERVYSAFEYTDYPTPSLPYRFWKRAIKLNRKVSA